MKQMMSLMLALSMLCCMLMPTALAESNTMITLSGDQASVNGGGAFVDGNTVTIASAGTYIVTGTLNNGQLLIDADKKDKITLILRNAEITNAAEAALLIRKADKVTIDLEEGTASKLISGAPVQITAGASTDDEGSGAALHAKSDLTITGSGTLYVGGYVHQGIRANKDLRIEGGQIAVEAIAAGIRCKDKMEISGGILGIISGGDGIHAASEATETTEADGHLLVSGGTVHVTACADGLQSETTLEINGGMLTITTNGGAANAPTHANDFDMMRGGWFGTQQQSMQTANETSDVSCKALKSAGDMTISGGTINIDACDDAVCSRNDLTISDGVLTAASGDDGLHADHDLTISGGVIEITKSYEGIEAASIVISDGTISVVSADDGLNASNGSGSMFGFGGFGMGGRQMFSGQFDRGGKMGQNRNGQSGDMNPPSMPDGMAAPDGVTPPDGSMSGTPTPVEETATALPSLLISGGTVLVNAQGDGLDSNGNLLITGGLVIVDGPDNSGNGALDSGSESGGYLRVTGGTVLAIGAVGMNESFDSTSEQAVLNAVTSWNAGDEIVLTDAAGHELIRHTAARNGQSIIYSDAALVNDAVITITIGSNAVQATVGTSGSYGGWGNFGGFGNGHGRH